MISRLTAVLLLTGCIGVNAVASEIVFSNFGPGMTFSSSGWAISRYANPGLVLTNQIISEQFTPGTDYTFTDARVAAALFSVPASLDLLLQADAGGVPGTVLEQMPLAGLTGKPSVLTENSALFPVLRHGVRYWLTMAPAGDGVLAEWNWNSSGDNSGSASTSGTPSGGSWYAASASDAVFEIDGDPLTSAATPEPGMAGLILAGTVTLSGFKLRRWKEPRGLD